MGAVRIAGKLFLLLAALYVFSVLFIFAPLYNIRYVKEVGWDAWINKGELIATGRAIVWPYYAFAAQPLTVQSSLPQVPVVSLSTEEKETAQHFTNTIKVCGEMLELFKNTRAVARLTPEQSKKALHILTVVLAETSYVKDDFLLKLHPEMPVQYNQGIKNSLQMLVFAIQRKDHMEISSAALSFRQFVIWFKDNRIDEKIPA